MNTGTVEANLLNLLAGQERHLSAALVQRARTLIERKVLGYEGIALNDAEAEPYLKDAETLAAQLAEAGELSTLPDEETAKPELNDLLLRMRRKYG